MRLIAAVCFFASLAAPPAPAAPALRPALGVWYTAWWTKDDQFHHWADCGVLPLHGPYDASDPQVIAAQYAQLRDLGVDFLIMDDTNGCGNDGGRINGAIRAWFDFMDGRPAGERVAICIGSGGEMRAGGRAMQQTAANFYWDAWAQRPSYYRFAGKPLLLIDTDKNSGPGDFDDPRFTVRWCYNGDNWRAMAQRKTWGWGSYVPSPILEESMAIWPGHRFHARVLNLGRDPEEQPREGGELYVRLWLRALKANPRTVTVADWNNFQEETALEDSYSWQDPQGRAVPDLYRRITRAYSRLRAGTLVKGEFYRDEARPEVYLFDGARLIHQGATPGWATVIQTPAGMLERISRGLPSGR